MPSHTPEHRIASVMLPSLEDKDLRVIKDAYLKFAGRLTSGDPEKDFWANVSSLPWERQKDVIIDRFSTQIVNPAIQQKAPELSKLLNARQKAQVGIEKRTRGAKIIKALKGFGETFRVPGPKR